MKELAAVLLALLLCGLQGRGRMQEDKDDDGDFGTAGYDEEDEEEEEEEEAIMIAGSRGRVLLQCYTCQSLHRNESCEQMQNCIPYQTCKTIIYHWNTESDPQTTYSGWCADTCQPITKMVVGTLTTITCCQSRLCNVPPWQGPPGTWAGSSQSSPKTVATTFLLSLLAGFLATGF
ncbi:Glycosylphosphatidylinositol-anchored high density lipoprotein-binding protein 1 [Camelus dromedarius]|uniref:Glycosylphosphatidylinositol-anchored high density lipoprotein-binding protein 1 n=2 Tax=Camelus dromedarius TaxID=9838 RepID=A0A5N4CGQ1_CAMDR|nr:glycosylphosphatidylinositol-anchored high density lipoprotein-binding protein 1 isoform X1 [Camelus dromedarius]XP_031295615.1 glycosylphosphatidylinositol-anchored high density lipoprotein-binding protein 1 isoform X1 [Camelus dromedarius]KAB1258047.1 Glycosylphosphatidylinositol-anchored high density lipoprotein-binding protein 1 [Camelus dromedarius]